MYKQILNNQESNTGTYVTGTEFNLMTNDSNKVTKRILTLLLKRFTLLIELKDRRIVSATYKNFKLVGRTPQDIILIYDELTDKEIEVNIDDIRIVRVCK